MKSIIQIIVFAVIVLLFPSCEKEVFTGLPSEPNPSYGKLYIDSDPQGAAIYINNKNSGFITPDTVEWLELGSNIVKLKHELFGDTSFTVNVTSNEMIKKFIDYKSNKKFWGTIYCSSKPTGAKIFINDENTNEITSASFTKLPGTYEIKFTYPEHRADSVKVTLYGSMKTSVNVILEDTTIWVSYTSSNSQLPSNIATCIAVDNMNNKWIGTRDKGVVIFDENNWTLFNTKNSQIISDFINCLKIAGDQSIWVGTSVGLSMYKDGIWTNFPQDYLHQYISDIAFGPDGSVYVATEVGLAKFSAGNWELFTTQNSGIAGNFITCVTVDNTGKVWAGTNAFGVSSFDGTTWKTHTVKSMGLAESVGNIIRFVTADNNNNIWVAHAVNYKQGINGGLTKFDGTNWSLVSYFNVLTNLIESIYVDKYNSRWIGTTGGLSEITEQDVVTNYTSQNSKLPLGRITGTTVDHNNRVWVSTLSNGISKYKR